MEDFLCKCNNCDSILIDHNPQTGAKMFPVPNNVLYQVLLKDEFESFWGCPECKTDEYLTDL